MVVFVPVFLVDEARAAGVVRHITDNATGGDCTLAGTWNQATKTCTLTANTTDLFSIDSNNITLDGAGYTITGTNTGLDPIEKGAGIAVNVVGRSGVTVKNIKITRFDYAVDFVDTNNSTVTNVTATNSAWAGISLTRANNNTLTNNVISNNNIDTGICVGFNSSYNIITGNSVSGTERGVFVHTYCTYNNINNNTINDNVHALTFYDYDSFNFVSGNTMAGNQIAILGKTSSNNVTVRNNGIENNGTGLKLENVSNFSFDGNRMMNNTVQATVTGGSNNSFNGSAANGGGNLWSNFDSPVEGCIDSNSDGFCDTPYSFTGGKDNLPKADPVSQNSGGNCEQPQLRFAAPNSFWNSYQDYLDRKLSANMAVTNYGTTNAYNVNVVVTLNTNGVRTLTPMPIQLGAMLASQTRPFSIQYYVPTGVQMFNSTLFTAATVGCGTTFNNPDGAPVV